MTVDKVNRRHQATSHDWRTNDRPHAHVGVYAETSRQGGIRNQDVLLDRQLVERFDERPESGDISL